MFHWLVVGVSGVTNGGKSTLTRQLMDVLPSSTRLICQDDYFYPEDSPYHVPCPGGLSHHNWDVITSMDMARMKRDILNVINSLPKEESLLSRSSSGECLRSQTFNGSMVTSPLLTSCPVLLLDGFLLYDDAELTEMCDLRLFITLTRELCWERRRNRVYDPPDPEGYFDACVWPMYEEHLCRVRKNVSDVLLLDGKENHFEAVLQHILEAAKVKLEKK